MDTQLQTLDEPTMFEQLEESSVLLEEPIGDEDEFYYGYRTLVFDGPDGKPIYRYRPLTLADFLDPEEGDVLMQGTLHYQDASRLYTIFAYLHRDNSRLSIFGDFKILWGIPGLSEPAPDVVIIPDVREPEKPRGSFDVQAEGTRPIFILEVVSPRYREPDIVAKPYIYAQAGVQEYVIVDSRLSRKGTVSYEVTGYRLQGNGYIEIQPNQQGQIYSQINHVWIGPNEAQDGFLVIDAQTGEPILSAEERAEAEAARAEAEANARKEAEAAQTVAEARVAALEAELRALKASSQTGQPKIMRENK